jgi:hypothetical protein
MTDYNRTIIFAEKDARLTGDPLKVIRGREIDVELDNASVASKSKYDNEDLATKLEAEAGTSGTTLITPATLWDGMREFAVQNPTVGDFIPLAGTSVDSEVTGPVQFKNSIDEVQWELASDLVGTKNFGFVSDRQDTSFTIAFRDEGVVQGLTYSSNHQLTFPSKDAPNTEAWQMGATTVIGDPDVFLISAVDAFGGIRSHPLAITTSPAHTFVFHQDGYALGARSTEPTDQNRTLVTKDYVDDLIPPGGGEANTASSAGAGNSLVLAKSGIDLPFKSLVAGTDVTIDVGAETLTINSVAGGGGGLPAGLIDQGLRNDAGTNTYVATGGLLIDASGQVAVGPGSVTPIVPLQVSGTTTLLAGGSLNLNNPGNSATSFLQTEVTNRLTIQSPAGGGIDILGATGAGTAVDIKANGTTCIRALGGSSSVDLLHSGGVRLQTTAAGLTTKGEFVVTELANSNQLFRVETTSGNTFINGTLDANGTATVATLITSIGSVTSNLQVTIGSSSPSSANHATRKDYVDAGLAAKANASNTVTTDTTQTITGFKSFTAGVGVQGNMDAFNVEATLGSVTSATQVLINSASPTAANHATRRDYVDAALATAISALRNDIILAGLAI